MDQLLEDTIEWYLKAGAAEHEEPHRAKSDYPLLAVWPLKDNRIGVRLVYLKACDMDEYLNGHTDANAVEEGVCHEDDYDRRSSSVRHKQQYLYMIVSERMAAVKVGVTGLSEFELITRYTNALARVYYHMHHKITNGSNFNLIY